MITPIYAAILSFVLIYLIVSAVRLRNSLKVALGDGEHPALNRAIRSHGNFVETAPWGLLLMVMLDLQHGSHVVLHGLGILLVVGRLLHIYAIRTSVLPPRIAGMALTMTVFAVGALYNLFLALSTL